MFRAMLFIQVSTMFWSRSWLRRSHPFTHAACAVSCAESYDRPRDTRKRTVKLYPFLYAAPYHSSSRVIGRKLPWFEDIAFSPEGAVSVPPANSMQAHTQTI